METRIKLTDRDKQIILDCCKFKGLTKEYFAKKYFNGNTNVCHTRLYLLTKAGYLNKIQYIYKLEQEEHLKFEGNEQIIPPSSLRRGNKRTYIYHVEAKGQKAVEYKTSLRTARLSPNPDELEKHILLSKIYSNVEVISASETRTAYKIANIVPVLCSLSTPDALIVVAYLDKNDIKKAKRVNIVKTLFDARIITSPQRVVFTLVSPFIPKELSLLNFNYLSPQYAPGLLSSFAKDLEYYKKSFQQVFLNAGYSPLPDNGIFWQVTKGRRIYNIAELVTGSSMLMRALHDPPPGAYIYAINATHLPKEAASQSPFLLYSRKDNATYRVSYDSGSRKLEKISKGVAL